MQNALPEKQVSPGKTRKSIKISLIGLMVFFAIFYVRFKAGSLVTATSVGTWYQTLNKASFNPPDGVFSSIWVFLYFLMAVAGWLVWRHGRSRAVTIALCAFAFQLTLNFLWSIIFFGFQRKDLALIEIIMLFFTVVINVIIFWRIDRIAALLIFPYLIWIFFATVLTFYIWILN